MEYDIKTLEQQHKLIEELSEKIITRNLASPICILKPHDGVTLHSFMQALNHSIMSKKTLTLRVYTDFSDANSIDNQDNNETIKGFLNSFQLSISNIAGISFQPNIKEDNYMLLNNKEDTVFLIKYWDINSSAIKEMILKIIRDADSLKDSFHKKIYLIIVYNQDLSRCLENVNSVSVYNLHKLSSEDAKQYLREFFDEALIEQHGDTLYKWLGGNLKSMLKFIRVMSGATISTDDYDKIFHDALKSSLKNIKDRLDERNQESLNYLSVMPEYLNPYELQDIIKNTTVNEIDNLIDVLNELSMMYQVDDNYYYLLNEIKAEILNARKAKKEILLCNYYRYMKQKHPLDYVMRAHYLQLMKNRDTDALDLYILALGTAFRRNDKFVMKELRHKIENSGLEESCINEFKKVYQMYEQDLSSDRENSCSFYDQAMKFFEIEMSDLICSEFLKNDILRFAPKYTVKDPSKRYYYVLKEILVNLNYESNDCEKAHYAACIIVLLPHLKDKFGDVDTYDLLNKRLKEMERNDPVLKKCMVYHDNIMLRKSFMDETVDIAINNYNRALKFFKRENDIREQYMTLSGLMGLFISNAEFEQAEDAYAEIVNFKNNNQDCLLPGYYKTENNRYILDFFHNESILSISDIKSIIRKLSAITEGANSVSKAVIYTNIAALSLYIDEIDMYEQYKKIFEKHMNYDDSSDVYDTNVEDFYAYYFAWFEFGKAIMQGNFEEAQSRYDVLNGFVPTIFKQHSAVFSAKYKKYKDVLGQSLTGKEFALFVIENKSYNNKTWNFFGRGFMVSDLQHTSFY